MDLPTDRLRAQISGPSRWRHFEHHPEVGSTNDLAHERFREQGEPGVVVVTDKQTAGRGRSGRTWEDRPEGSLLVSFAVAAPPRGLTLVPLVTGLAVSDALRRHRAAVTLKWPNDILLDERKCAGILVEHHLTGNGGGAGAPGVLVIGIGINLDWRGVERDGDAAAWTSVAEAVGEDVDRWDVLADVMRSLDTWLGEVAGDPTRLLASYQARCSTLGQRVEVTAPGESFTGLARGLTPEGALIVDRDGQQVAVTAGDVVHVRLAAGG